MGEQGSRDEVKRASSPSVPARPHYFFVLADLEDVSTFQNFLLEQKCPQGEQDLKLIIIVMFIFLLTS